MWWIAPTTAAGVAVAVGAGVALGWGVGVGVAVAAGLVGVGLGMGVGLGVAVGLVRVGLGVGLGVAVGCGPAGAVGDAVGDGVGDGVGLGVGPWMIGLVVINGNRIGFPSTGWTGLACVRVRSSVDVEHDRTHANEGMRARRGAALCLLSRNDLRVSPVN